MKVGDVIYRKDMPMVKYKIMGEHDIWYDVALVSSPKVGLLKNGLIAKDDERWVTSK